MQSSPTAPGNRSAPGNRFWMGASLILFLGIVLRQLWLGQPSFFPDEAIHTFFAMGFGDYHYDPVFHGPLLYHLVAAAFGLMHQNDVAARIVPSLLGVGLVALVIGPFRLYAGNRGALASAALVAVSPSIVTYSRRLLHDSLALFLTMGAVLCLLGALKNGADTERGRGARIGLFAFLSLFLATKANCFFIAAMLLAFWIAWRLAGVIGGRFRLPIWLERAVPALLFALLIAVSIRFPISFENAPNPITGVLQWTPTRDHQIFKWTVFSLCTAFGLWLLTMPRTSPTESQSEAETPRENAENAPQNQKKRRADIATSYFLALAGALWLYVFLYGNGAQILTQWVQLRHFPSDTLRDGAANARGAIPKMLSYWGGQQALPRLPGRHDYYWVLALLYEVPIVLAAFGGIWHASKNRSVSNDLLLWWSFSSIAIYALANEKVPWLLVHITLPLALLGGVWLGQLKWKKSALALATVAGLSFSLRGAIGANFERGGDHAEPIFYAHTPESFRDVLEKTLIETRGDKRAVWMDGERQWPSVWYLRQGGPEIDGSGTIIGGFPVPESLRAAVVKEEDWTIFAGAGWQGSTVDFLIFPRASWTALQPARYWRWQWTRDTLPQSERDLPQSEWKTSILAGKGEWSHNLTVVGWPITAR